MTEKTDWDSDLADDQEETPAPPASVKKRRPTPGKLRTQTQSDVESGRIYPKAPKKDRLNSLVVAQSLTHGKSLFKDDRRELDASAQTERLPPMPPLETQDNTAADISVIAAPPDGQRFTAPVDASSGNFEDPPKSSRNSSRRNSVVGNFMEFPPDTVSGKRRIEFTDSGGMTKIRTERTIRPDGWTSPLHNIPQMTIPVNPTDHRRKRTVRRMQTLSLQNSRG